MDKSIPSLIKDEHKAARDYEDSAKKNPHKVAKRIFRHIKGEEVHHAKELAETKKKIAHKMK